MSSYEQKLSEFAEGKRLLRLSRPVRDRADAACDVCGSAQPRTLYPLKDQAFERYYFVGDTCLGELVKRGAILRRFGKESGKEAYDLEMERRVLEQEELTAKEVRRKEDPAAADSEPATVAVNAETGFTEGISYPFPVMLTVESPSQYRAIVCMISAGGSLSSWGYAEEARCEEKWQRGGERGMVLERVTVQRPDALDHAVTRAWNEACSNLESYNPTLSLNSGTAPANLELTLPRALLALFSQMGSGDDLCDRSVLSMNRHPSA